YKRHAISLGELVRFLQRRVAENDAAWHRPVIDSKLEYEKHVERNEPNQQSRDNKHMDGEKPRQCRCSNEWTSQQEAHQRGPDNRNSTGDGGSNSEHPVDALIKAQHLPADSRPN